MLACKYFFIAVLMALCLPNEVAPIKLPLEMAKMRPNTTEYHNITIVFVVRSVFSECLVLV
jgi:hypothetical protein